MLIQTSRFSFSFCDFWRRLPLHLQRVMLVLKGWTPRSVKDCLLWKYSQRQLSHLQLRQYVKKNLFATIIWINRIHHRICNGPYKIFTVRYSISCPMLCQAPVSSSPSTASSSIRLADVTVQEVSKVDSVTIHCWRLNHTRDVWNN
jgi:hypothetical protein